MVEDLEVLQKTVCFLANALEAHTVAYIDCSERKGVLTCIASHSLSDQFRRNAVIPLDQCGIFAQVRQQGKLMEFGNLTGRGIYNLVPFYSPNQEDMIKAICITPIGVGEGFLYADTKQKWNFGRKEICLIQDAADLIRRLIGHLEKIFLHDDYVDMLTFFYETDRIIESPDLMDSTSLEQFLGKLLKFINADWALLINRNIITGETQIRSSFPNITLPKSKKKFSGGLVDSVFSRKRLTTVSRIRGKRGLDHFLLFPGEPLPREGSFLGLYGATSGDEWVLAFLSKDGKFWESDRVYGVDRVFRHFLVAADRVILHKECEHLLRHDCFTGLLHIRAFEEHVRSCFSYAMENNRNIALIIIQWEPYLEICSIALPSAVALINHRIVMALQKEILSEGVVIGQLGENRLGILLEQATQFDIKKCEYFLHKLSLGKEFGCQIEFYSGMSRYPQDVTNIPELWGQAYQSLQKRIKGKHSSMTIYDESAIDVLIRADRTLRV
ncbi:MAG: hypothetical protein N2260_08425 [Syntrophobacterales bacterium]|nr:hypothetical protein [Syntrophobacterales bacterium]